MSRTGRYLLVSAAGFTIAGVTLLAGCASTRSTEQMLTAAGFQMKMAETPEQQAHLKELTQRKIVPHQQDGETYYVFADAKGCKCLYAGDQNAYQRYENELQLKKIADEELMAAEENYDASMNWGLWSDWGWW